MKALLRMFNAVHTENKEEEIDHTDTLERTIKHGYILHPYIGKVDLDEVESVIGISGEKANSSFHKSWSIVKDSPIEQLVIQQLLHYITTYGFEALGVYNEATVYIPHEKLEIPEIKESIPLTVVKAMDSSEIASEIVKLGSSGIALKQETLNDLMSVVSSFNFDKTIVDTITNREFKSLLSDYYGIVPKDPLEFLRHLVSKLAEESLLIKNDYLIGKIKESNGKFLDELLRKSPDDLASIFYRYKPLFLAMKSISRNKKFFNDLRRKAVKQHKPLKGDVLNDATANIKKGKFDIDKLNKKLETASIWRKIRLLYALKSRIGSEGGPIVYKVRNGKGWATNYSWPSGSDQLLIGAGVSAYRSIIDSLGLSGKVFYIPENINYTLPATEKQFTGNFPNGSYVTVESDLIAGIYWEDNGRRIDLDLSVIGESGKVGWDSSYRTDERDVLFSGDVTSAPNGASELFYFNGKIQEPRILMVNYYNYEKNSPVQGKIMVASEKPGNFCKNYMVDVNNIIATANVEVSRKQEILGLLCNVNGTNRLYFSNISVGVGITSSCNEQSTIARKWLMNTIVKSIDLKSVLIDAGANVVSEKPEIEYIDLSPEQLNKTTIIDILK